MWRNGIEQNLKQLNLQDQISLKMYLLQLLKYLNNIFQAHSAIVSYIHHMAFIVCHPITLQIPSLELPSQLQPNLGIIVNKKKL